ncbi:MAG: hypothetical protein HXX10_07540 [Rhodoplanes sp.]|uniref:hypothetical protein n=1 Tax=Rhodoplanes sp. TaxID=1968906 RepID=UPI0018016B45|nr:hypothetical protein [Rhodoplanes sp.]NVO13873.1 hypothetical protein [Rhodoplanes sp.]
MPATVKAVAAAFVERAEALGLKGVKRDTAALDFFCGAATLAELSGNAEASRALSLAASLLVSVRGYMAVKQLAAGVAP